MQRYQVIEYKRWEHISGRTASIFSLPYVSESDAKDWRIVSKGFTIRDNHTNTQGLGRQPFKTYQEAQEKCEELNNG